MLAATLVAVPLVVTQTAPAYAEHSGLQLVTTSATAGNAALPADARLASDDGSSSVVDPDPLDATA